ncbi:MAG: hypothetical protein HY840_11785 [Bacteroidetes bacterium]|nr:hypothetical protein [Bacteroidota bacterium]
MKEDNKLLDVIIDLAQEMKGMRKDMNTQLGDINTQLGELNGRVDKLEKQFEKMEKQQAKTNLELGEMRLSYMKIDKRLEETNIELHGLHSDFNKYAHANNLIISKHETRIIRLEDATFDNKDKRISMVKEPKAEYKKKKK